MNIPIEFEAQTRALLGDEQYSKLFYALNTQPSVSVRLNPFKVHNKTLNTAFVTKNVPWCSLGHYLSQRASFTFDPLFHAGCYYVQEASSMFIHYVASHFLCSATQVLDLCAAPGGKTTALRSALPNNSLLFANEPIRNRANVLAENMQKFGHTNVVVTNNYAVDYKRSSLVFDAIVADVPCSGEGMFRKEQDAIQGWTPQLVKNCASLQRGIVEDIWTCLKEGGIFIYSTCTFNAQENEENVAWIMNHLGAECVKVPLKGEWNIQPSLNPSITAYRFMPSYTEGEGLFMCVLRKTSREVSAVKKARIKKVETLFLTQEKEWITNHNSFSFFKNTEDVVAVPTCWAEQYGLAQSQLKVISAGVTIGEYKGKTLVPHQSLALSTVLNTQAFAKAHVSYEQAIAYLRKEAIVLPTNISKGIVLLCFKNVPIGFVKNLGNRANNLYPSEWKIKSSHIPQQNDGIIL